MSHAESAAVFPHVSGRAGAIPVPARGRVFVRPDARWDALLVCLAGYILVAVGRVHQIFPALDVIRPVTLTGLLAIAIYVFDRRADRRLSLVTGGTSRWVLALLAWMALSVPTALVVGASFDQVFGNFIKTVIIFFVVAAAVRGGRDLERLAGAYLFGSVVYAAVVLARFDVGGTADWRLGHLYYYDANDFATFAVTAMPLAIYFVHRGRGLMRRFLAVVGLGMLCVAFVYSGSRGGFLALLAMGAFILLRYSTIAMSRRLVALAIVGVALLSVASERYWQQMGSILSSDYNQTEESGRMQIWQRGIGYMLQRPIFGVGANNFEVAEGTISPFADRQQWGIGVRWNAPHNSFIQVGAELGIPGLVFFVAVIGSALLTLHRLVRRSRWRPSRWQVRPELLQALTASIIGFVVGAFFLTLAYSELLYMLLAFVVGARKVLARQRPAPAVAA